MLQTRKIATAVGTFAVALSIGFVMQNGDALASRMSSERLDIPVGPDLTPPAGPATASVLPVDLPILQNPTPIELTETASAVIMPESLPTPAMPGMPVQNAAVTGEEPVMDDGLADVVSGDACISQMSGVAGPAALVDLELLAPCAPMALVTIHHQGMMFSVMTDENGRAAFNAPALATTAIFIAEVAGQEGVMSIVPVPEFEMFDRAVVQWQGDTGLELHALEAGATYGDAGHVWADASREATGEQGFLVRLGDDSLPESYRAEVYTYPAGQVQANGAVMLSVEAPVTAMNCGQMVQAQTIQVSPGDPVAVLDLEMIMPGCDATGEYLVLNNLLTDLTLASR